MLRPPYADRERAHTHRRAPYSPLTRLSRSALRWSPHTPRPAEALSVSTPQPPVCPPHVFLAIAQEGSKRVSQKAEEAKMRTEAKAAFMFTM